VYVSRCFVIKQSLAHIVCGAGLLLWLTVVVGCSGNEFGTPSDELAQFIAGVADSAGNPETFQAIFAAGTTPDESERSKYGSHAFWAKNVSISGDMATVTVEVSDSDDRVISELEWTAVQEAGQWKLKTAPLP